MKGPRATWRFVRGVSHGLRMGRFFPAHAASHLPTAPGSRGSETSSGVVGTGRVSPRTGITAWQRAVHELALPGLAAPVDLLHLSDVHLRRPDAALDHLCTLLQRETADLVVLTGDLVTRGWTRQAVERFLTALPPARLGRFAILGNWEHWSGVRPEAWRRLLAAHGVQLLIDEVVEAGPIALGGTDDMLAGSPDLRRLRAAFAPLSTPRVVLSHSPAMFPALRGEHTQLVLSGHSHGGQVIVPLLGPLWVPRGTGPYVDGWYTEAGTHLFVHRGVGWSIAPLRLGCPPELVHLRLLPPGGGR